MPDARPESRASFYKRLQALALTDGEYGDFGESQNPINTVVSGKSQNTEPDYESPALTAELPPDYVGFSLVWLGSTSAAIRANRC